MSRKRFTYSAGEADVEETLKPHGKRETQPPNPVESSCLVIFAKAPDE